MKGSSEGLTMTTSQQSQKQSWNRGRIIGPKPPLKPKNIWAIRTRLVHDGHVRDLAMFNVAIDSKLRGCDLVPAICARASSCLVIPSWRARFAISASRSMTLWSCPSTRTFEQGRGGPAPPGATEMGWKADLGLPSETGSSALRPFAAVRD